MRKFTIFSIILSVVVMVVVAEIVVNDYLPRFEKPQSGDFDFLIPGTEDLLDSTQANILGNDINTLSADLDLEAIEGIPEDDSTSLDMSDLVFDTFDLSEPPNEELVFTNEPEIGNDLVNFDETLPFEEVSDIDFENTSFVANTPNVYLRDEQIRSAGFTTGYLADDQHNGYFFKTIYVGDLADVGLEKKVIRDSTKMFVKVYIFTAETGSTVGQIFNVLKLRSAEGLNVESNETNGFGLGSFYMNDATRQNVAFLTVKFANVVYGFSYPKEYHPQVVNLIKLIDLEF